MTKWSKADAEAAVDALQRPCPNCAAKDAEIERLRAELNECVRRMQRIHAPVPMSAHLALAPPIQEKP